MKIPSYVMLRKKDEHAYLARLTNGNVYKVTGMDRREGSDYNTLIVIDDEGGASAVSTDDCVEVPYTALKLVRILFE